MEHLCQEHFPCGDSIVPPELAYSSEDADVDLFIGFRHVSVYPRLGDQWTRTSCLGLCVSTVSQEDADLCAQRNATACASDSGGNIVDPPCATCGNPPDCVPGDPCTGGNGGCVNNHCGDPTDPGGHVRVIFYNVPQSCTVLCPDGTPFTHVVPAGIFAAVSQAIADAQAYSWACLRARLSRICLSDLTANCCTGTPCPQTITSTGGTAPLTWDLVSGSIPTGMVASNTNSGRDLLIGGTPTAGGTYTFTYRLTDSTGSFSQKQYTISVLGITTTSLPSGVVGTAYSAQLLAAGGTSPYTFAVTSGSLPDGLTMDTDGLISGTPTTAASSTFTVTVTDANSHSCRSDFTISVSVGTALMGMTAGADSGSMPGITSLAINHTTNPHGYQINNTNDLLSISFPALVNTTDLANLYLLNNSSLTTVSLPVLQSVSGALLIQDSPNINSLSCPKLASVPTLGIANAGTSAASFPLLTSMDDFNASNSGWTSISMPIITSVAFALEMPSLAATSVSFPALVSVGTEINLLNATNLTSINFHVLASVGSGFLLTGAASLTSVTLGSLISVGGDLDFETLGCTSISCSQVASIGAQLTVADCPSLTNINFNSLVSSVRVVISACASLSTFSFPALVACDEVTVEQVNIASLTFSTLFPTLTSTNLIGIGGNATLTSANLSGVTFNNFSCVNSTALANVNISGFFPNNGDGVSASNCALNSASVDHILQKCIDNPAYTSGTVDVSGGTNAAPTGALVTTLTGRGVIVLHN